jgi:hypothetical protein
LDEFLSKHEKIEKIEKIEKFKKAQGKGSWSTLQGFIVTFHVIRYNFLHPLVQLFGYFGVSTR